MAEGPSGDQRGGSMDTGQDLLLQREQPGTPEGSSRGAASLSLAATAPGANESGELPRQERQRIELEQETIKPRFKPGESL